MKWLSFAWRNCLRNKRRTAITAGIICVGTLALLVAVGFILATFYGLREVTIHTELGHIQIANSKYFEHFETRVMEYGLTPGEVSRIESSLSGQPHIRFSMSRINFEGLISTGERTVAVVGQGVEPSKEIRLSSMFIKIDEGRSLIGEDQDPYQIVIGSELARNLGAKANQNVTLMATTEDGAINALDVRIAGIYSTGIPEQDKHAVMVPLNIAKSLLRTQKVSKIIVALDKTEYTDAVISQLKKDLSNVDIRSWITLAFYYQRVVILYRNVFCIMGAIILLVVLLSSINSMLMNIMERVREVGTMRSMGIPRYEITKVFLLEGTFVGLLGTVAGAILAIILSMAINVLEIKMAPPPGRNMPYPLVIMMDCDYYLVITLIMVVVSSIAAWLPARRVVKMKIVDALGHN